MTDKENPVKNDRAKPDAKIVELIRVRSPYGKGTKEDICRQLEQYFEKDGTLVFEIDSEHILEETDKALAETLDKLEFSLVRGKMNEDLVKRLLSACKALLNYVPEPENPALTEDFRKVVDDAAKAVRMSEGSAT